MTAQLTIQLDQYSTNGRKTINQDFYGAVLPKPHVQQNKGIACVIADGISSSNVSHIASEVAVFSFLSDYFSTPESWSVKTSADRVIRSINTWLFAQTQQSQGRQDKDQGYVSTLSALILKGHLAHIFHIGDARIYRLQAGQLEQLTQDHQIWLSSNESYLSRALGVNAKVDIDYQTVQVYPNDIFLLMTDGVYEHLSLEDLNTTLSQSENINDLAKYFVKLAYENGSDDNLTLQIIKVDQLPEQIELDFIAAYKDLNIAPTLDEGAYLDQYKIEQIIHHNHRSTIYKAYDELKQKELVIKVPSLDLQQDSQLMQQFLLEEWIAQKIDHVHVLKSYPNTTPKTYVYHTLQYVQGITLARWFSQQKLPLDLTQTITIIEQVARALMAFHRLEMVHQDLRPENIMIDPCGKVTLIDFGSVQVTGLRELSMITDQPLGTFAYIAPEYLLGEQGTAQSDQFSLAVMTYYLLTGQLPYSTNLTKCKSLKELKALRYHSLSEHRDDIPIWVDHSLEKALSILPHQRYQDVFELIYDLKHKNHSLTKKYKKSLLQKNPVLFWQAITVILFLISLLQLIYFTQ